MSQTAPPEKAEAFEAIVSASTLKDFIAPIGTIVDEFRLELTDDGFEVATPDPANVALVTASLDASAFESYHPGHGGEIGIPLGRDGGFADILGFADADDLVHLELNPETLELEIEFDTVEMSLSLINTDSIRPKADVPDIELAVDVTLTGAQFSRSVDLCDMVSDHARFVGDPDNSQWIIRGDGDLDDVDDTYSRDDLIQGQVPDEHDTLVSCDYLKDMIKPIPKDAEVTVRHGTEKPLKWWYNRGDVEVQSMLAPRIQER